MPKSVPPFLHPSGLSGYNIICFFLYKKNKKRMYNPPFSTALAYKFHPPAPAHTLPEQIDMYLIRHMQYMEPVRSCMVQKCVYMQFLPFLFHFLHPTFLLPDYLCILHHIHNGTISPSRYTGHLLEAFPSRQQSHHLQRRPVP